MRAKRSFNKTRRNEMKNFFSYLMAGLFLLAVNAAKAEQTSAPGAKPTPAAVVKHKKAKTAKVKKEVKDVYVCSMCHVKSDKPGKCPQCGMEMVKESTAKSKAQENKMYACSKCGLEGDKPGECPHHCGGKMVEKK